MQKILFKFWVIFITILMLSLGLISSSSILVSATNGSPTDSEVISVNVKKYMNTGDINLIPVLKPGDTVVISGTVFRMFSRFATFVSQIAIVAYFVALITK